jgi:hypothetical protein
MANIKLITHDPRDKNFITKPSRFRWEMARSSKSTNRMVCLALENQIDLPQPHFS